MESFEEILREMTLVEEEGNKLSDEISRLWEEYYTNCGFISKVRLSEKDTVIKLPFQKLEIGDACPKVAFDMANSKQKGVFLMLTATSGKIDIITKNINSANPESTDPKKVTELLKEKVRLQKKLKKQLQKEISRFQQPEQPVPPTKPKVEKNPLQQ